MLRVVKPHGVGTVVYPDGNKYVGEWMNGLFHGQVIYTIASDGYNYVSEYRIGNLWNGTMKEKDGTIDYKVVNWKKNKKITPLKLTIYKIRVKCASKVFEDNLNNY